MKETDLFKPVRSLFLKEGYDVQGEILQADLFAVKDNKIVIVELKLQMSLKLIYQVIDRQMVTPHVYMAIPKLVIKKHQKNHNQFTQLLKKLGVGLIEVTLDEAVIIIEPNENHITNKKSSSAKKKVMLNEFNQRDQYLTVGGTNGKKMTYYREQTLEIAKAIHTLGEASLKLIKEYTRIEKTAAILRDNYDGWFQKNEKGLHELSPLGKKEIEQYLF